jgi:hypothetical protein
LAGRRCVAKEKLNGGSDCRNPQRNEALANLVYPLPDGLSFVSFLKSLVLIYVDGPGHAIFDDARARILSVSQATVPVGPGVEWSPSFLVCRCMHTGLWEADDFRVTALSKVRLPLVGWQI